jgi:hypothetical protein
MDSPATRPLQGLLHGLLPSDLEVVIGPKIVCGAREDVYLAATLLNTTTMQNVACPTIIVKIVNLPKKLVNTLFKAIPVTMPGSAMGNTNSSDIDSRPKNLYLDIAAAAKDPKIKAITVAKSATTALRVIAYRTPSLTAAFDHHVVVKPVGGQANEVFSLKELITTKSNGTYINEKPNPIIAYKNTLVPFEIFINYLTLQFF